MSRIIDYRSAMLAADAALPRERLVAELDARSPAFADFIIAHGLGPLWHSASNRPEFRASRLAAEALFIGQENALRQIDAVLNSAGIDYVTIKGAANRLLLYDNPALRACHDIDLLVSPADKVTAAAAIASLGFCAAPEARSIGRELVLSRAEVNIDLHWSLLREGRLRRDVVPGMLRRRRRLQDTWILSPDDTFFGLIVHPAFAKHLAGWDMGLHRVVDIGRALTRIEFDWELVTEMLRANGVRTAGWATLRWLQLLSVGTVQYEARDLLETIRPGRLRRAWLDACLQRDIPGRLASLHWLRLAGFTMLLHDSAADMLRATRGRYRAKRRSQSDLSLFAGHCDE